MRDVVYSLSYGVLSRAVLLLLNAIAVRILVPEEYGLYSYLLAIIASVAALSGVGSGVTTNMYLAKYAYKRPEEARKVVFSSVILVSLLAVIVSSILVYLTDISAHLELNPEWLLRVLLVILVWLMSVNSVFEGCLNGLGVFKRMSLNALIVFAVALPIATFLFLWKGFWGGIFAVLTYRLLIAILNAVSIFKLGLLKLSYPLSTLRERYIVRLFGGVSVPTLMGALMTAPVVAFGMQLVAAKPGGLISLGYFSWIYQVYIVAVFIPGSLSGYFLSKLSRDTCEYGLINVLKINLVISLLVAASLLALKAIILGYAGADYVNNSGAIFDLMLPVIVLFSLNLAFASYWSSNGLNWLGFFVNMIWAILLLITTWIVLRSGSGSGLALPIGFLVAYLAQLVVQVFFYFAIKGRRLAS